MSAKAIALVLVSFLASLPLSAAQTGSGTFLLSNDGVWPAGSTQTVTLMTIMTTRKKLYVDNMSLLLGGATVPICQRQFGNAGGSASCSFTVPDNTSPSTGTVSAQYEECTDILGGPAFCSGQSNAISSPVAVLAVLSPTTATSARTTTSASPTTTSATTTITTARTTLSSTSSSTTSTATNASSADSSSGSTAANTGIIVGCIIGAIVLLIILGMVIWRWLRARNGNKDSKIQLYNSSLDAKSGPAPLDAETAASIRAAAAAAAIATGMNRGSESVSGSELNPIRPISSSTANALTPSGAPSSSTAATISTMVPIGSSKAASHKGSAVSLTQTGNIHVPPEHVPPMPTMVSIPEQQMQYAQYPAQPYYGQSYSSEAVSAAGIPTSNYYQQAYPAPHPNMVMNYDPNYNPQFDPYYNHQYQPQYDPNYNPQLHGQYDPRLPMMYPDAQQQQVTAFPMHPYPPHSGYTSPPPEQSIPTLEQTQPYPHAQSPTH
ncbi:hypothetical protein BDV3_001494 [Batrachochytrium dendrobatidis]